MSDADDAEFEVPGHATDVTPIDDIDEVDVTTSVEVDPDDGTVGVSRAAAFAEVANRPKQTAIDDEQLKNDVKFFDDLVNFDAELSGTLHAQSNAAASGPGVTHPALDPFEDDRTELEKSITEDCRQLLRDLKIQRDGTTFFLQLIKHGNDVSFIEYEEGSEDGEGGVVGLRCLPLRALTIIDDETYRSDTQPGNYTGPSMNNDTGHVKNFNETITDADWYLINEGKPDIEQAYPAHDILHMAMNRRGNWHKDRKGRDTYGVWGERRLEAVKYSLQAKQNTLANKVAMDDKLLAREYFYINVEDLFGHITDPDRRLKKAREYAEELRSRIETLDADQKPILPEEVEVSVEGPDGDTARSMSNFIQTMNDSIQHALNYHVSAFGRDAGGTDRANKPAKEMSDNSVRHLRKVVKDAFRELFRIHAILRYEDAREVVDPQADDISRYRLADDVRLPELTFDPVDPQEQVEKVRNAISMYEKGVAGLNEARYEADLEPVDQSEIEDMYWFKNPSVWTDDDDEDARYKNQTIEQPQDPAAEMQSPGDSDGGNGDDAPGNDEDSPSDDGNGDGGDGDSTGNRRSYPTDSDEDEDESGSHDSYETYGE